MNLHACAATGTGTDRGRRGDGATAAPTVAVPCTGWAVGRSGGAPPIVAAARMRTAPAAATQVPVTQTCFTTSQPQKLPGFTAPEAQYC